MLALRLTRVAHPAVHLRRLLVATAAAGTGFLLLSALGHAMGHAAEPGDPGDSALRLAWCAVPLAATVYFAVAVARTDPGTRPRTGLSALGLGPARLMAISALTTALSCALGSMLALLFFLHLRGDLTGMPFDGAAAEFLAADQPLPLPAALTLLTLVPAAASASVALTLRPRDPRTKADGTRRPFRRGGAGGHGGSRETYGRFGTRPRTAADDAPHRDKGGTTPAPDHETDPGAPAPDAPDRADGLDPADGLGPADGAPDPQDAPSGLPWGIAVLAAGLAVEAYASRSATGTGSAALPGGTAGGSTGVLAGWVLTALGLILAGPGLAHLCGRLLQAVRPGALRLLAGRVLMAEATRIGRPLGVVCAVVSGVYAMSALYGGGTVPSLGPLATLGTLVVSGCALATLLTAAVEARQARADTTAALLRLGAPASMLRSAAALRAGALCALFGPLSLVIADLAALPLAS
ncbi:hypothetical protein ACIPSA_33805 [Streptomyces sp. NPDC086549]|uniref:hypothetical protein n=1 Tax=Streptomyces sp. NPDC086549 TaxID=3365752 RepID=UPI0037FFF487